MFQLNLKYLNHIDEKKVNNLYENQLNKIKNKFIKKSSEMMGWIDFYKDSSFNEELKKIREYKNNWKKLKINYVVVIGIGGSYLGVKAIIDAIPNNDNIEYLYLNELSNKSINELYQFTKNKNWAIVVISKSGTTAETSVNFRFARELLLKKYKNKHSERIIAITSKNTGILCDIAKQNKYKTLTINDDIGGRYSALTSVGLFLFHYKNIDINNLLKGYNQMINFFFNHEYKNNFILQYVAYRDYLNKHKKIDLEILHLYDEKYFYLAKVHQQLFAESEGKKKNTIIPMISILSNDLHSMGQLYQQGNKNFFQTTIFINEKSNISIPESSFKNDDKIDVLKDKTISWIKKELFLSVVKAHTKEASNQNLIIEINDEGSYTFGAIYAFICLSAATSCYLNKVNPFNQPGVENYKLNFKKRIKL